LLFLLCLLPWHMRTVRNVTLQSVIFPSWRTLNVCQIFLIYSSCHPGKDSEKRHLTFKRHVSKVKCASLCVLPLLYIHHGEASGLNQQHPSAFLTRHVSLYTHTHTHTHVRARTHRKCIINIDLYPLMLQFKKSMFFLKNKTNGR
jgi:hypothetical protein